MRAIAHSALLVLLLTPIAGVAFAREPLPHCLLQKIYPLTQNGFQDGSTLEYEFTRNEAGNYRTTLGTSHVSARNLPELFSHEYAPGKMGAKGLGYIDSRGDWYIVFWETGVGHTETNVHHRDVLANFLEKEASRFETDLRPRIGAQRSHDENWMRYIEVAEKIPSLRKQGSMPVDILQRAQGFQLTAEPFAGKLRITHIDVDSSITGAQASRGMKINLRQLALMIQKVDQAIDPEIKAIKAIRIKGLLEHGVDRKKLTHLLHEMGVKYRVDPL